MAFKTVVMRRGAPVTAYLIAEAWRGRNIEPAIARFLELASGRDVERLRVGAAADPVEITAGGAAHLVRCRRIRPLSESEPALGSAIVRRRRYAWFTLTINGSKQFPDRHGLLKFIRTVAPRPERQALELLDRVTAGINAAVRHARSYARKYPDSAQFVKRLTGVMRAGLKRLT